MLLFDYHRNRATLDRIRPYLGARMHVHAKHSIIYLSNNEIKDEYGLFYMAFIKTKYFQTAIDFS